VGSGGVGEDFNVNGLKEKELSTGVEGDGEGANRVEVVETFVLLMG